ncbi:MAG TPA: hypothetical protein PL063_03435 [Candidatus Cloacimonadota bacterium]|jgi:hypothetical protein|nr:hypothetical protein [Candidatus Cloacimonadales bacterium]HPY96245.1 hypothetical protein [Candidatus Cloacimonadota bacterium]HQB40834.1 hypothetical protein [Candidatus Cloacimonadota bacterium]
MKKISFILIFFFTLVLLQSFPISDFNYHLPNNTISPYSAGLGGINLVSAKDNLAFYDNPALLSVVKNMTFAASFNVPDKNQSTNDLLNANVLARDSKFRAFGIQAQNVGFLYNELANDSFDQADSLFNTYQDFKLRSFGLSFADTTSANLNVGLSLRYLDGRLVYLREIMQDTLYYKDEFIDSKAMGFGTDLGIYGKKFGLYYGFVVHDLFSKIYWEGHPNTKIHTRGSFAAELRGNNTSLISSVTSLWNIHETPIYSQALNYTRVIGNPNQPQILDLRFGATSVDYKKSDNIMFTYGTSYMIKTFKLDIAAQTRGLKINTAQYMFSLSIGA